MARQPGSKLEDRSALASDSMRNDGKPDDDIIHHCSHIMNGVMISVVSFDELLSPDQDILRDDVWGELRRWALSGDSGNRGGHSLLNMVKS